VASDFAGEIGNLIAFAEVLPAAVALLDEHGVVLYANPLARGLLGEEAVGQSWRDLADDVFDGPQRAIDASRDPVLDVLAEREPWASREMRTRRRWGSDQRVLVSVFGLTLRGLAGAVLMFADGAVARRTRRLTDVLGELESHANLLQAILRGSQQAIALLDGVDLRVRWGNEAFKTMLGLPTDASVACRPFAELYPDADTSGMTAIFRGVAAGGESYEAHEDEWPVARDGVPNRLLAEYWDWSLAPVPRADAPAPDLLLLAANVTHTVLSHRRTEGRLRELEAVLAHMSDGVIMADHTMMSANPAARRILGLPDDTPKRFRMSDLLRAVRFEALDGRPLETAEDCSFLQLISGDSVDGREMYVIGRDEVRRVLSLTGTMVVSADASPFVVISIHDVTVRKDLERRLTEEAELDRALNRVNTAIGATFDARDILRRSGEEAARALQGDGAFVVSHLGGEWLLREAWGRCEGRAGVEWSATDIQPLALAAQARMPVFVEDIAAEPGLDVPPNLGGALVVIPFVVRGNVRSVVCVVYPAPRTFSKAEEDFVDKLMQSVSLSLENARLYMIEHRIAESLQESLLALPDKVDQIDFSYLYRPAKDTARVGGDFYDIFELDEDRVAFLIGDVSGKGLEAAAMTSLVKSTLKAHAYGGDSPATTIAKTNAIIVRTSAPESFSTVFFGILSRGTRQLVYCGAGHPPALLLTAAGTVRPLETRCPVLGALPEAAYVDSSTLLLPDDRLVLYTDGITEARREKELFGETRLAELLERRADVSVHDIPQALLSEVSEFAEGRLHDDIALLALSLQAAARTASLPVPEDEAPQAS